MATRRRRGFRISEILQHPYSLDGETQGMEGHSPHSTLPLGIESSPSRHPHSVSLSQQKTPARSYFQRSYNGQHGTLRPDLSDVESLTSHRAHRYLSERAPGGTRGYGRASILGFVRQGIICKRKLPYTASALPYRCIQVI